MQTSLLANLYQYFKGSQEDVATASLQYIISNNVLLSAAFTELVLSKLHLDVTGTFQYKCQISGQSDEKERPDMSGYDENGTEQLLSESKFYASLTINQPNTYLKRLIAEKGKGLIFICPEVRKTGLWTEIIRKVNDSKEQNEFIVTNVADDCVDINNVRMSITTWTEMLNKLTDVALSNNIDLMDIKQLRGYCEQLDTDAFIPFDESDLGIENAVKIERHARVIDEVFMKLTKEKDLNVSTKGLHVTPQRTGYNRYFRMKGYNISLVYDTNKWKKIDSYITPYWIKICHDVNGRWEMDEECHKALLKISEEYKDGEYLALVAPCRVTLDEIADSMKEQILNYLAVYESVK